MDKFIILINNRHYLVEYINRSNNWIDYIVYRCEENGDKINFYDESETNIFEGTFSWRGCWDNRMMFFQREYLEFELKNMSDLYEVIKLKFYNIISESTEYELDKLD